MKRPLFWGFLCLGLAIIFSYKKLPVFMMLLFGLPLILSPIFIKSVKYSQIGVVLFIYLTGLLLSQQAFAEKILYQDFYEQEIIYSGKVQTYPEVDEDWISFIFKTDHILPEVSDEVLRVSYYGEEKESFETMKPGDNISFLGVLKKNTGIRNPGDFDYGLYLKSKGIKGQIVLKNNLLIKGNESGLKEKLLQFKKKTEDKIDASFDASQSDLLKGILLSDSLHYKQIEESFQNIGIAHVLAVSGLHVGFLYLLVLTGLKYFKVEKKYHMVLMIPILTVYCFLTGCSASVIRASIMLFILMMGDGLHVEKDGLNNLFLSGIIILMIWPAQLFQAGFQLSMGAVSGIIFFNSPLNYQFEQWVNRRHLKYLPINNPLIKSFSLTLSVLLGAFPILMFHFGNFSGISFFSNLIIVPMIGLLVNSGFLFLLLTGLFPFLTSVFAIPVAFLCDSVLISSNALNDFNQQLMMLNIENGHFDLGVAGIILLSGFVLAGYFGKRAGRRAVPVLYSILMVAIAIRMVIPGYLEIIVLDVGQGDSILINTPDHQHYLIDGGGYQFERENRITDEVLYPAFRALGIKRIDAAFLSHNHEDHKQGIEEMIQDEFEIDHLFMSTQTNNQYLKEQTAVPVSLLNKGATIEDQSGVRLEVLSPADKIGEVSDSEQNNASLVMLLSYKMINILFCGDIEKETETQIIADLREKTDNMDIQVIKVPHHGSNTSSSAEFIDAVKAEMAIISVGENNLYGHPDDEVLKRYNESETMILRTDLNGAVVLKSNGDWIKWETYLN